MFKGLWFHDIQYVNNGLFIAQGTHNYIYILSSNGIILNEDEPLISAERINSYFIKVQRLDDRRFSIINVIGSNKILNQWFDDIYAVRGRRCYAVLNGANYIINFNGQVIQESIYNDKLIKKIIKENIMKKIFNKKER